MSEQTRSIRAFQNAAVVFAVSAVFELAKQTVSPRISLWTSHAVTILFVTAMTFFLSRLLIRREQNLLHSIKVRDDFSDGIIQNLPASLCIFGAEGSFLRWNTHAQSMLGYSPEEISQLKVMDIIAEEDRDRLSQQVLATLAGNSSEAEALLVRRDGTRIPAYLKGARVVFEGRPCVLGIAIDISPERSAQEQLRLQATALAAAANGIIITTRDGTIEWANPAFEKISGFSKNEIVGKNPRVLKSGRQGDEFYRNLWSTIASGNVWKGEIENCRKDGSLYTEEMTITPVVSGGTITHYIAIKDDVSARKQAEEALQQSEKRFRLFVEHAPIALAMFDREMRYLCASLRWLANYSTDQDMRGVSYYEVFRTCPERWKEAHRRGLAGEVVREEAERVERLNGTVRWVRWELRPWYDKDNHIGGIVIFSEDISDRMVLETQLQQAQKMEAIGRLAGGVAHDFNNILGVITGFCELLRDQPDLGNKSAHCVEQIHLAGKKAASLTQQLLAFSRKQIVQPRILNLNEVVRKLSGMLRRLIDDDIELAIRLSDQDAYVYVDASQIDQVLMNLAVNARDAMPHGGKLMIETDECDLDEAYAIRHRSVRPGRYVRLTITDSGSGMDQETMAHLFEPFFTTKELGKGTGLGLSIVYGIVKQSDGYIWVYSEPGQGTSFKIYLPSHSSAAPRAEETTQTGNLRGSENVLLVEDDDGFRSMVAGFLKGLGYSVLEANNGEHALQVAATAGSPIELVMTDLVMPKMGGRDLADRMISTFPGVRVLYTSGYTHDGVVQTRVLSDREMFLQKPFALSDLSKKIREVLER